MKALTSLNIIIIVIMAGFLRDGLSATLPHTSSQHLLPHGFGSIFTMAQSGIAVIVMLAVQDVL